MEGPELFSQTRNSTSYPELFRTSSSVGDFTPFYVVIALGSVILGLIIILNIICCCSVYSDYWLDKHTGNRWIVSIWSATPHKQPPLDLTELKSSEELETVIDIQPGPRQVTASASQQPLTSPVYLELHKRESDI